MAGFRVRYSLATKLVNELVEAADEKILTKTIARYGRVDLLCIDELGYMELDRRALSCCSRCSPNRGEEQRRHRLQRVVRWVDQTFTDPRLCAAIVDRLTFGGKIIQTGTESYRLASARAARAQDTTAG